MLRYLIENRYRVVSKNELLDELWGHRYVSEWAISTQIKSLRKAVGDDGRKQRVIKTVHGKGYRFVADLLGADQTETVANEPSTPLTVIETQPVLGNLHHERTPLFGREEEVAQCAEALTNYRMVSLLGIGGTGKTRLAKAVGRTYLSNYAQGVWFVDLVPVHDRSGIDLAVANAIGLAIEQGSARDQIAKAIDSRKLLLILDNCEHIADEVAVWLDYFLENTREPKYLITSRDPINLEDELRFIVDPLPIDGEGDTSAASSLFLSIARRHGGSVSQDDLHRVQSICANLDGLPLAIELAASQLRYLTLAELDERLEHRFEILTGRQRQGEGRKHSLFDVLNDTWQLLEPAEQELLGLLAVFPAQFTMTDVEELLHTDRAADMSLSMSRIVELCLISRSSRSGGWWRLLESVRVFVNEQLSHDDLQVNADRHAQWCLRKLGQFPHDHQNHFEQAQWCLQHFESLLSAAKYFRANEDLVHQVDIFSSLAFMVQLDEGARARVVLREVDKLLEVATDPLQKGLLHGVAALSCQCLRVPELLHKHGQLALGAAREADNPAATSAALVLASLTTSFVDAEQTMTWVTESIEIAKVLGDQKLVDVATGFYGWHLAIQGQYPDALEVHTEIAERNLGRRNSEPRNRGQHNFERHNVGQHDPMDNPTHSAVCGVIACSIFENTEVSDYWCDRLRQHPNGQVLWGAQVVIACALAASDHQAQAAQLVLAIKSRLDNAGREGLPDLLVPAAVLAYQHGEHQLAQRWVTAVRRSSLTLQSYHVVVIYRRLRNLTGVAQANPLANASLSGVGQEAMDWVQQNG